MLLGWMMLVPVLKTHLLLDLLERLLLLLLMLPLYPEALLHLRLVVEVPCACGRAHSGTSPCTIPAALDLTLLKDTEVLLT